MTAPAPRDLKGFQLHERIGVGGFGEVYRATQTSVGRDVAIKLVLPALANDPDFVRRFEIEAQLVASLEHPHITPLYDYWRDPDGAYLVMRYYPRGSLAEWLEQGAFSPSRAARLLDQLASAVDLAHEHGIVHRDIKPSNVLLDEQGNAYLSDFGIAKSRRPEADGLTRDGAMVGSPDYLAPEQARGESVRAESDVYSLGVLLHEILGGQHPFHASSPVERLAKHLHEPLPPLTTLSDPLRRATDAIIERATSKAPEARYRSAGEFARAFRAALQQARPGEPSAPEPIGAEAATTAPVEPADATVVVSNPFIGLRSFRASDADNFHGRERLVGELIDQLGANDGRLLALVGPSGSGKSSVLHAGLLPALRTGALPGSERWFITNLVPSARPLDELEVALTRVAIQAAPSLRDHLTRDEHGLTRISRIILPDDGSELVIAIDQFEELFTLCEDETTRRHLLDLLHAAVTDPRSRIRVVLTLRADFYDRPLQLQPFADLLRHNVETVVPMNADELERAITRPAGRAGLTFEDGVVTRMIDEVRHQPGVLPLLQFALTRLFEERDGTRLTLAALERVGGVAGALARHADDVYVQFDDEARAATRQLTLRLVALGEGSEDTRRRVLRSELDVIADDPFVVSSVVERLAHERLVTLDHDASTREPTVELAHEALLREWTRLRTWLDESRSDVRMQRELDRLANAWAKGDRDASFLLRGLRLEQYDAWRRESDLKPTGLATAFVEESLEQRERDRRLEADRQARADALRRRARSFLSALVVVLLVSTIASGALSVWANRQRVAAVEQREVAEHQRAEAEAQRQEAEAERQRAQQAEMVAERQAAVLLASQADTEAENGHTDRAILLALEALENYPYMPQAERALSNAVTANRAVQAYARHELPVPGGAWSPDGSRVATAGQGNQIHVWNADDGRTITVLQQPSADAATVRNQTQALSVAFGLGGAHVYALLGDRFLFGSQDYLLTRTNLETGEVVDQIEMPNDAVPEAGEGASVSARKYWTGQAIDVGGVSGRVATLAGDDRAAVWPPDLSRRLFDLTGHDNDVAAVAWSPSEALVATGSYDGTARIWDGASGAEIRTIETGHGDVNTVAWSPDGRRIATGGNEGSIHVWSVDDGTRTGTYEVTGQRIQTLAWSADGEMLAVGGNDSVIRLVHVASGGIVDRLAGHGVEILHLAWSPDGARLLSTSSDTTARIWTDYPATTLVRFPWVGSAAFWSADGSQIAINYSNIDTTIDADDAGLALWDFETQEYVVENALPRDDYWGVFQGEQSPTDTRVLARTNDSIEHFFDGSPMTMVDPMRPGWFEEIWTSNRSTARTVAWAPSGQWIASATLDGRVDLYDADTYEIVASGQHPRDDFLNYIDFSPDERHLLTSGDEGTIFVWDARTLDVVNSFSIGDVLAAETDWSPDGRHVVVTGGTFEGVLGAGNVLAIHDPFTGERLLEMTGHFGDVVRASFSPNGTRVASASTDDTLRVWDAETGDELMRTPMGAQFFAITDWSPNGDWLTVSSDVPVGQPRARVLRVWQSTEELVDYALDCCVFRDLTDAERRQFALDLDVAEGP